jgi:hypothetical protein
VDCRHRRQSPIPDLRNTTRSGAALLKAPSFAAELVAALSWVASAATEPGLPLPELSPPHPTRDNAPHVRIETVKDLFGLKAEVNKGLTFMK